MKTQLLAIASIILAFACAPKRGPVNPPLKRLNICKQELIFENLGSKNIQVEGAISDNQPEHRCTKSSSIKRQEVPPGMIYVMTLSLECAACGYDYSAYVDRKFLPIETGINHIKCKDSECTVIPYGVIE